MSSPAPWPAGYSHPCAKCGTETAGIAVGGLCADCARRIKARAARLGRWGAIATTLPLALYETLSLPPTREARIVGAAGVVIWYVLTSLIGRRIAWEWLK
jgi:hypothetical protein